MSENEIIILYNVSSQSNLRNLCIFGEKNILQTVLLLFFFFSLYILNALQSDNNSNTIIYVLVQNIFWTSLRAPFNPCVMAQDKMSLSQTQKIFMPMNINSMVLVSIVFRFQQQ